MPAAIGELIAHGRIVDLILAVLLVETAALLLCRRRLGRGPSAGGVIANALAGAFLLLALREALRGEGQVWIGGWLLAALAAHVADVRSRWRPGRQ
ncbi:MAG: hypothetical protein MUE49_01675 [Rhodospirillales bacterium]|jgi:hypothetical protein|nr:hypothetical protein [Rhodospirillales bacterium]